MKLPFPFTTHLLPVESFRQFIISPWEQREKKKKTSNLSTNSFLPQYKIVPQNTVCRSRHGDTLVLVCRKTGVLKPLAV